MGDAEFLDVGPERRPRLSSRRRWLLLVAGAVLAATALVVDRWVRDREERAVAACAEKVAAAVEEAGRPVRAAYEYVRHSLADPTPELQDSIRRLTAKVATGAEATLAAPRETCADVDVFPLHDDLQARRDRCVTVLEVNRAGLASVAADGSGLGDWLGAPRTC